MREIKAEMRELIASIERGGIENYKIVDKLNQLLRMLDEADELEGK